MVKCPKCGGSLISMVVYSEDTYIVRERKCDQCDNTVYTAEVYTQQERIAKRFMEIKRETDRDYDIRRKQRNKQSLIRTAQNSEPVCVPIAVS